jgi:hypothetical protein
MDVFELVSSTALIAASKGLLLDSGRMRVALSLERQNGFVEAGMAPPLKGGRNAYAS